MISKLSKMQNSWFTKAILTITALSFVSLFGVSGYINTANNNKAVITVDEIEVSQSEFNYRLQKELTNLQNFIGDNEEELDARKNEIADALAKIMLENALIDNTMKKHNLDVSDSLVRKIILVTPHFMNNGQFDKELYDWYLNRNNMTEHDLIVDIKRDIGRKILVDSQVVGFNVPKVLQQQIQKILGQRRTFKYVKLANDNAKITRNPSSEEMAQYYEDFAEEFRVPEKRDITVMLLPSSAIESQMEVTDEEIAQYYKEHIEEYEQPEKRNVLQMVFADKESADKAYEQLVKGGDFVKVATEHGQSEADIKLGEVAPSDLSDELAEAVFALNKGQTSKPTEINDSWQIVKMIGVVAPHKVAKDVANAQIKKLLQEEKAYDGTYEIMAQIEDKIGAGVALADIAKEFGAFLHQIKNLAEDGSSDNRNLDLDAVTNNRDVIDAAFSYNEGEVSQTIEGDDGLLVVQVDKINEAHIRPQEEVSAEIINLWKENERASITQETVDNIVHDMDAGDTLKDVASRYHLPLLKTMPITRSETFADLSYEDMKTLFADADSQAKVIKKGDDYVVVELNKMYDDSASLTVEEKENLHRDLIIETAQEMADALLKDYADDYKVEVNYNRMGINY